MKLYGSPFSPNSRRAELCLAELEVDYEFLHVDLAKGEQRTEAFLALNPNGKVPVLIDGDFTITESNAIAVYLAAKYPERGLGGRSPMETAEISKWMFFNAIHLSAAGGRAFAHTVLLPEAQRNAAEAEAARKELGRCLAIVEQNLTTREWLAGSTFSLADVAMSTNAYFAMTALRIDFSKYPAVQAWLGRMMSRPAWIKVYGT
jgi:glutathione S-transferase